MNQNATQPRSPYGTKTVINIFKLTQRYYYITSISANKNPMYDKALTYDTC